MLTELQLGNFKAFAETQRIPIRPLTLIFGPNSGGKSSILHSLLLGCHAIKSGELDVHQTEVGGDAVDLGGFRQFVHRGDSNRCVEWGITLETAGLSKKFAEAFSAFEQVSVKTSFGELVDSESKHDVGAQKFVIETDDKHFLEMESAHTSSFYKLHELQTPMSARDFTAPAKSHPVTFWIHGVNFHHPLVQRVLKGTFAEFSGTNLSTKDFNLLEKNWEDVCHLPTFIEGLIPEAINARLPDLSVLFHPVSAGGSRKKMIVSAARGIMHHFLGNLFEEMHKAISDQLGRVMYLGPLRSYPSRRLLFPLVQTNFSDGSFAWQVIREEPAVRAKINQWLGDANRLNTTFELLVRDWLDSDQAAEVAVKALRGAGKPAGPKSRELVTKALGRLAAKMGEGVMGEVLLKDKRTNTIVSHRDIGVGISQVLPILVAAHATKNHIHAIEQPELHLHPALQAELGDVFIESALGERKNIFLLETHSEHLLLRIMRRMRETASGKLPKSCLPVTPANVALLYVQPDGARSIVREIPLNERGELLKRWPGGFFEESLREVLPSYAQ